MPGRPKSRERIFSILFLSSQFYCLLPLGAQNPPSQNETKALNGKSLVRIEIIRIENTHLSEKGISEARIFWKTAEAVLFQVRRGYNCQNGEPLDKIAYSGVTQPDKENTLRIRASALKAGINYLVICINRAPLTTASSNELDYSSDVYEKNILLMLDNTPPLTVVQPAEGSVKNTKLNLTCYDDSGCESISYTLEGGGRSENFTEKNRMVSVNLSESYDWVQTVRFSATDKAGNKEAEQQHEVSSGNYAWFGNGRFSAYPLYMFRLDSRQQLFSGGLGIGLAADLPLNRLIGWRQNPWVPGARVEGRLLTFTNGTNTEDSLSEIGAGLIWLLPLKKGSAGALVGGLTGGAGKYFGILNARQVATSLVFSGNLFAGYEYSLQRLFVFVHWRLSYATISDMFMAHGAVLGAGCVF